MDPRLGIFNATLLYKPIHVCHVIRVALDGCFSEETAYPGSWDPKLPVKGHCAAVAIVVQRLIGGSLVSATVNGESHWFNMLEEVFGGHTDVDLTGDQFGFPKVNAAISGELYPGTRVRHPDEVKIETIDRADILFARLTQ